MAKTRSMTRNQNHDDASCKSTINTCDNSGVVPWLDLNNDVLLLVMMKLGVVDSIAFSGVCKSWRSLAVSNMNMLMVSKPPMAMHISIDANEKQCYLEDFGGRKFKTILPHSAGRMCIGVTCGYLILFGEKTKDFWLVNLITRHELHFPDAPVELLCHGNIRAILVFSPSTSEWVFVLLNSCTKLWFSIAGKQEWTKVSIPFLIHDLHALKGKIYTLHSVYPSDEVRLCEIRLYPEPKVVLLKIENFPKSCFILPGFVSSGENLYVVDRFVKHPYKIHELDFGEMKLVSREKAGEEYVFFLTSYFKYHATIIPRESWADLFSQHGRYVLTDGLFYARMWYFFHDCLNANFIHE